MVGLIGLVIIIVLITNSVRRRRARKFDKEIREATLAAAATTLDHGFDDDDEEDRFKPHTTHPSNVYNVNGDYSDASHGTYAQPPMDTYTMPGPGPGVGDIVNPYPGPYAGIGLLRTASLGPNSNFPAGLQEARTPYPKFAAPQNTYVSEPPYARNPMDPAGTIFHGHYPQPGRSSQDYPTPSDPSPLTRNLSGSTQPYQSQPQTLNYQPQAYPVRQVSPPQNSVAPPSAAYPPNFANPPTDDDAYGGYVDNPGRGSVDSPDRGSALVDTHSRVLKVRQGFHLNKAQLTDSWLF